MGWPAFITYRHYFTITSSHFVFKQFKDLFIVLKFKVISRLAQEPRKSDRGTTRRPSLKLVTRLFSKPVLT